jgi:hypothetical protein
MKLLAIGCGWGGTFRARNIQLWQALLSPHGVDGRIRVYH